MNANVIVSVLAVLVAACSGQGSGQGAVTPKDSGASMASSAPHVIACSVPTSANTFAAGSNSGCQASPAQQICTVTSGATILLDGAIEDGSATCSTSCPPYEYELVCDGPPGTVNTAPLPAPSLNCTVGPGGPLPSNEMNYCCACAQ